MGVEGIVGEVLEKEPDSAVDRGQSPVGRTGCSPTSQISNFWISTKDFSRLFPLPQQVGEKAHQNVNNTKNGGQLTSTSPFPFLAKF